MVIGGTAGIGLAVAEAAAREGADVVVASRRRAAVDGALRRLPEGAEGQVLDVTDEDEVRGFFARIGDFDHLVFTAGEALLLEEPANADIDRARRFLDTPVPGRVHGGQVRRAVDQERRFHRAHHGHRGPASDAGHDRGGRPVRGDGVPRPRTGTGAGADPGQRGLPRCGPRRTCGGSCRRPIVRPVRVRRTVAAGRAGRGARGRGGGIPVPDARPVQHRFDRRRGRRHGAGATARSPLPHSAPQPALKCTCAVVTTVPRRGKSRRTDASCSGAVRAAIASSANTRS